MGSINEKMPKNLVALPLYSVAKLKKLKLAAHYTEAGWSPGRTGREFGRLALLLKQQADEK